MRLSPHKFLSLSQLLSTSQILGTPKLLIVVALFLFYFPDTSLAFDSGFFRLNGALGFGAAGAEEKGTVRVEAPLALYFSADYAMNSRYSLGFEHHRSFGGSSTSIGLSGLIIRYYPWTPQPQRLLGAEEVPDESIIVQKNIVPYIGLSLGLGQANFPSRGGTEATVAVVSPYVALKGGLEYPFWKRMGMRGEFAFGNSVAGNGQILVMHFLFGIYYIL